MRPSQVPQSHGRCWGSECTNQKLFSILVTPLKFVNKVFKTSCAVQDDVNVIKYWLRLAKLGNEDPVHNAFNRLVQLHNFGQKSWWTEVSTLLELLKIDDPDILATAPVDEKNKIVASIKDSIFKTQRETCMARLKDNSEGKLRTFQKFKTEYCMETYLLDLPNLDHLTAVARLRMSAHRLAIETGRHVKPKISKEERICKNCALEEVEDESHFLLKCPLYCQQRTILMRTILSYTTSESQEELFIILMKSKETAVIKALGKYIHTAFKMREEHMSLL